MRIGITGAGSTADKVVRQVVDAERRGFDSVWFASAVLGDPLVAIALAGRETTRIELGTSVLQTYPAHPLLMANRAVSVAAAMGRPGFTLGVGPSHDVVIEGVYGLSYARPGRHTEEYVRILVAALGDGSVDFDGELLSAHGPGRVARSDHPVPVLVGALAPHLLRVAGELAAGTITWMTNARALDRHVVPRIRAAAAGRPEPRVVAGVPVAVTDDVDAGRAAAAELFAGYGVLPNYQRILEIGGIASPGDMAVVGTEEDVRRGLGEFADAGATDLWAAPFPVGEDRQGSRSRTLELLASIAGD